jgi:hypothetical protein
MARWSVWAVCFLLAASVWGQGNSEPTNSQENELQRLRERVAALEKLVQVLQAELAALKNNGAAPPLGTLLVAIRQQADEEKQKLEEELKRELEQQPIPSLRSPSLVPSFLRRSRFRWWSLAGVEP